MSVRWSLWLIPALLVGGLCLLAFGAYMHFTPRHARGLEVAETDVEVLDCKAGEPRAIVFRFHNSSGKPIRILGIQTC
jgi:hypothetical protein